jgi:DNA invertase Pin-like site-specific DNA recombinase
MEFVREGDELVVLKLDRLGRNTRDVLTSFTTSEREARF